MGMPEHNDNRDLERKSVPELLIAWSQGDQAALSVLVPLVDAELRRLAHHYLKGERRGHTLQTTALINEVYLRLMDGATAARLADQAHFIAIAANLMRQILVDHARQRNSKKRGGEFLRESFDKALVVTEKLDEDLVALDEAMIDLAEVDERASRVVELRFFGGLSVAETATALGVSSDTVTREWNFAKTWLLRQLSGKAKDVT